MRCRAPCCATACSPAGQRECRYSDLGTAFRTGAGRDLVLFQRRRRGISPTRRRPCVCQTWWVRVSTSRSSIFMPARSSASPACRAPARRRPGAVFGLAPVRSGTIQSAMRRRTGCRPIRAMPSRPASPISPTTAARRPRRPTSIGENIVPVVAVGRVANAWLRCAREAEQALAAISRHGHQGFRSVRGGRHVERRQPAEGLPRTGDWPPSRAC
jgi:hypothetical protein